MGPLPHPPHPVGNGARPVGPDRRPDTASSDAPRPAPGGVSRLDRITLQLGVAVAVVIACCSYAVSATSLYALGVQAGYSWWQAAAVPVVADGPAIYGMFRIISRSRRGAHGRRLWLAAGHLRHRWPRSAATSPTPNPTWSPRPSPPPSRWPCWPCWKDLKGDAGEVTRLAAQAADLDRAGALAQPGQLPQATTVRRTTATANPDAAAAALSSQRRALPAGPKQTDGPTVGARLQAAYAQPRPDGQPWTARTLAEAAGCGRSSAAAFLQRQRPPVAERTG